MENETLTEEEKYAEQLEEEILYDLVESQIALEEMINE